MVTRYKEYLTLSFLVVAFLCVTLGNLLSSLGLIQMRRLDELFQLCCSLVSSQLDERAAAPATPPPWSGGVASWLQI